jgi:hypothetical protein
VCHIHVDIFKIQKHSFFKKSLRAYFIRKTRGGAETVAWRGQETNQNKSESKSITGTESSNNPGFQPLLVSIMEPEPGLRIMTKDSDYIIL